MALTLYHAQIVEVTLKVFDSNCTCWLLPYVLCAGLGVTPVLAAGTAVASLGGMFAAGYTAITCHRIVNKVDKLDDKMTNMLVRISDAFPVRHVFEVQSAMPTM